jgi:hypothetical protein
MHFTWLKQTLEPGKRRNNASPGGSPAHILLSCIQFSNGAGHQPADESMMIFTEALSSDLIPQALWRASSCLFVFLSWLIQSKLNDLYDWR